MNSGRPDEMDMPGVVRAANWRGVKQSAWAGKNAGRVRQNCSESAPARSEATRLGVTDGGGDPGPRRTSCASELAGRGAGRSGKGRSGRIKPS